MFRGLSQRLVIATLLALFAATMGVASVPATALKGDKWRDATGAPVESPSMRAAGGFGAQMILTSDIDIFEKWNKPGASVNINSIHELPRNKPAMVLIIFAGAGSDSKGQANVVVDLVIKTPQGKEYGAMRSAHAWVGHPAPPVGMLQLAEQNMKLSIDPPDPAGTYTIEATVSDLVKKVSLSLHSDFVVPGAPRTK